MRIKTACATSTETRWPWHMTVTHTDGAVREDDYADGVGGRPIGEYAQYLSSLPDVARVELTTVFVAGEQVTSVAEEMCGCHLPPRPMSAHGPDSPS